MTTPPHSAPPRDSDELWVALSADGLLRARAVIADGLCADAVHRHRLAPLPALALARGLVCAALVPLSAKDDASVSLQWAGGGVLKGVLCEARPADAPEQGVRVRGRVRESAAELWAQDISSGRIGRGLMPGVLRLMRQNRAGTVSHGEVPLVSGELTDDLEAVFAASEQVATRVFAAVALEGAEVRAARGALIQALPGCDPQRLAALEARFGPHTPLHEVLSDLLGEGAAVLERVPVAFSCPCSRARALAGLTLLGHDEVIDMIVKDKGAEVKCEMCAAVYRFTQDELLPLIEGAPGLA